MHSIFFQILSIFSSPAGYSYCFEFQVHILCIGMAPYWPTLQFYVCVYISFVCWYTVPLVSATTTLYYVVKSIFHRQVWYHALSLRYVCIRSSGIILIP